MTPAREGPSPLNPERKCPKCQHSTAKGGHYVPPSLGDAGFFACESFCDECRPVPLAALPPVVSPDALDAARYRALRQWHDAPGIPEFDLDEGADALIEAQSAAPGRERAEQAAPSGEARALLERALVGLNSHDSSWLLSDIRTYLASLREGK